MAAESGINGSVVLGANSILNISEWSIDIKNNIQDSTAFGDTWEQKLPGLKGATGNLKGLLNVGDTTGQALLKAAVLAGTTVALILYNNANHYDFTAFNTVKIRSPNKTFIINGIIKQFNYEWV